MMPKLDDVQMRHHGSLSTPARVKSGTYYGNDRVPSWVGYRPLPMPYEQDGMFPNGRSTFLFTTNFIILYCSVLTGKQLLPGQRATFVYLIKYVIIKEERS